jgi:hypothetical protein
MQAGCVCFSAVAPVLYSLGFYCIFDSNGVSHLVVRSSLLSIYYSPRLSDFIISAGFFCAVLPKRASVLGYSFFISTGIIANQLSPKGFTGTHPSMSYKGV